MDMEEIRFENTTENLDDDMQSVAWRDFAFMAPSVLLFLIVAIISMLLLKMFWQTLEPVHIFILNFFGSLGFSLLSNFIRQLLHIFLVDPEFCPQNFVTLLAQVFHSLSIILLQSDRFYAVYSNAHYKGKITNNVALLEIVVGLLVAVLITTIAYVLAPEYSECLFPLYLSNTKLLHLILVGSFKIIAFIFTIVVIIYIVIVEKRLAKTLPGPVIISNQELPQIQTDNSKSYLDMIANTRMSNLVMITYMITNIPLAVISFVYLNCKDCEDFEMFFRVILIFKVISLIFSSGLIFRRILKKTS